MMACYTGIRKAIDRINVDDPLWSLVSRDAVIDAVTRSNVKLDHQQTLAVHRLLSTLLFYCGATGAPPLSKTVSFSELTGIQSPTRSLFDRGI